MPKTAALFKQLSAGCIFYTDPGAREEVGGPKPPVATVLSGSHFPRSPASQGHAAAARQTRGRGSSPGRPLPGPSLHPGLSRSLVQKLCPVPTTTAACVDLVSFLRERKNLNILDRMLSQQTRCMTSVKTQRRVTDTIKRGPRCPLIHTGLVGKGAPDRGPPEGPGTLVSFLSLFPPAAGPRGWAGQAAATV